MKALTLYEKKKKKKYADRVRPHGQFIPLVCSTFGTLAPECARTAHGVANLVDSDREVRDATLDLHSVMIQVTVLKAVSLCLRSRSMAVPPAAPTPSELEDVPVRWAEARGRDAE